MIGDLDQRVTVYDKQQVRLPDGRLDVALVPRFSVWAEVKPKSGIQRNQAQQTENPADYEIAVRNTPQVQAILPSDILEWQGRKMNIIWVGYRSKRHTYLHIDAKDGVAV